MNLIPVIDLMQGQVVRAQRGQRAQYRPIVSTLCASAEPVEVARALCAHCAARQLYVADLDALQGGAAQVRALRESCARCPAWSSGSMPALPMPPPRQRCASNSARRSAPGHGVRQRIAALAPGLRGAALWRRRRAVLSLDRRDGQRLDPAGCWELPALWPERVIVMTLERVGADAGPDLDTLRSVQARAPQAALIGAGGIRDAADLDRARAAGAQAWLVASALHDGRLPPPHGTDPAHQTRDDLLMATAASRFVPSPQPPLCGGPAPAAPETPHCVAVLVGCAPVRCAARPAPPWHIACVTPRP